MFGNVIARGNGLSQEAGDPSVSVDLLLHGFFASGAARKTKAVLNIAAAKILAVTDFVTTDARHKKLAMAVGLWSSEILLRQAKPCKVQQRMAAKATAVLDGVLKADGTVELAIRPNLPLGRVKVRLEAVASRDEASSGRLTEEAMLDPWVEFPASESGCVVRVRPGPLSPPDPPAIPDNPGEL
jgi:hypothetical protein